MVMDENLHNLFAASSELRVDEDAARRSKRRATPVEQPSEVEAGGVEEEEEDDEAASKLLRHEVVEAGDKDQRTVFVGNVASSVMTSAPEQNELRRAFSVFGPIESIRFRSIAFAGKTSRKAAFIEKNLREDRDSVNAYIVFQSTAAAQESTSLNATVLFRKHIRVDSVSHPSKHETKRSVFVGSLAFDANEEDMWRHFSHCGEMDFIRIIRDKKTNVGEGFAYVQFSDIASVDKALLLDAQKMGSRKLRVTRVKAMKRGAVRRIETNDKKRKIRKEPKKDKISKGSN